MNTALGSEWMPEGDSSRFSRLLPVHLGTLCAQLHTFKLCKRVQKYRKKPKQLQYRVKVKNFSRWSCSWPFLTRSIFNKTFIKYLNNNWGMLQVYVLKSFHLLAYSTLIEGTWILLIVWTTAWLQELSSESSPSEAKHAAENDQGANCTPSPVIEDPVLVGDAKALHWDVSRS